MTAIKKMTVKNLAEEFEKLREEVYELRPLKKKVAELEELLKKVMVDKQVDVDDRVESSRPNFKCKKCEVSPKSVKELNQHIKDKHPQEIKCRKCSESFTKNSDLEVHIRNVHTEKEKYECEEC